MKDFRILSKKTYFGLLLVLFAVFLLDYKVASEIQPMRVLGTETTSVSNYPILQRGINPYLSAKGVVVMDAGSQVVLFSKNENLRFSSASTTKIMTALIALDRFRLSDVLTVGSPSAEGVSLGLKEGQKMTFENLLYGLLLPSANDAAFVIAQNYGDDFVKRMNTNAAKLNLYNTHYEDPAGLMDDGDYTTPLDLARLASIAQKNEIFSKIVSTKEKTIVDEAGNAFVLKNLNKLLGVSGITGIKTGTTVGAGQVLVTSKKEGGHTLIIVVMGSEDRYADTQRILDALSGNVSYLPIDPL